MPVMTGARFNCVQPGIEPIAMSARYHAFVEMARYADEHGMSTITLEEHHGADNGWSSAPLAMAGLVFGGTNNIGVSISALLLPLHDPLRVAEDVAMLDLASGGRLTTIVGLGYRPEEYAQHGKDWKARGALMDECVDALLKAWTGEPFEYRGATVRVTPGRSRSPTRCCSSAVRASLQLAARRASDCRCSPLPTWTISRPTTTRNAQSKARRASTWRRRPTSRRCTSPRIPTERGTISGSTSSTRRRRMRRGRHPTSTLPCTRTPPRSTSCGPRASTRCSPPGSRRARELAWRALPASVGRRHADRRGVEVLAPHGRAGAPEARLTTASAAARAMMCAPRRSVECGHVGSVQPLSSRSGSPSAAWPAQAQPTSSRRCRRRPTSRPATTSASRAISSSAKPRRPRSAASRRTSSRAPQQLQSYVDNAGPIFQQEVDSLRALPAPKADAKKLKKIFNLVQKGYDKLVADPSTLLGSKKPAELTKASKKAKAYGFKVCGQA